MRTQTRCLGMTVALAFLFAASAWAHSPRILVDDLGDGMIYIDVGFSDGSSGAGHQVIIKEKESGRILSEHRVPAESAVEIPMPIVPYIVVFDAGPGHAAEEEGPFVVREGRDEGNPTPAAPAAPTATGQPDLAPVAEPPSGTAAPHEASPPGHAQALPTQAPAPRPGAPAMHAATPMAPGAEMAWKMMLMTQVISTVLLALLFGAILFWIGYSIGKNRERR